MKCLGCICACLILFSCSGNRLPGDILPPDKMEKLIWEQMRADAFTANFIAKDSSKDARRENGILQEKIFKKYKTNKETFYRSYNYYIEHDKIMKDILDSVIAKETRKNTERVNELLK